MLVVDTFFPRQEGDAFLVHPAVMEMDASIGIALPVVEGPFLGTQGGTEHANGNDA